MLTPLRTTLLCLFLATATVIACSAVPYTGRQQLVLVSDQEMTQMGNQAAADVLKKEPISHDQTESSAVQRVGSRIARAANLPYDWKFYLIDNAKTANAFALPGGKVFVYTGLFKYVENDDELATVIGHEVGHVVARHGAERMSMETLSQIGGAAVAGSSQAFQAAYGIAANYGVILPYSRQQESEADRIGLILMAKAGYQPDAAVPFWQNMARGQGSGPPAFLSTHPATQDRIANIERYLPEARQYYRR